MALFKGRDENLPLLTQFFQLEIDTQDAEGGELAAFLRDQGSLTNSLATLHIAMPRSDVRNAQEVQAATRRVMMALAEQQPISTDDLRLIEICSQKANRTLGYVFNQKMVGAAGEHAVKGGYVLPQYIFLDRGGRDAENLIGDVCTALKEAVGAKLRFQVCPVCHSAYQVGRSDQQVCSHRDAARQSVRNSRLRKSIEKGIRIAA